MAEVSLEMLQTLILRGLDGQAEIRRGLERVSRENAQMRSLMLSMVDQMARFENRMVALEHRMGGLERRIGEVKDEVDFMLKAEIMGRMGAYELRIEASLAELEARLLAPR